MPNIFFVLISKRTSAQSRNVVLKCFQCLSATNYFDYLHFPYGMLRSFSLGMRSTPFQTPWPTPCLLRDWFNRGLLHYKHFEMNFMRFYIWNDREAPITGSTKLQKYVTRLGAVHPRTRQSQFKAVDEIYKHFYGKKKPFQIVFPGLASKKYFVGFLKLSLQWN